MSATSVVGVCIMTGDGLPRRHAAPSFPGMFVVDEETAAAIRRAWDQGGELAAVVELRRHFAAITDPEDARRCVRTIVSWGQRPAAPGQEQD